MRWALLCALCLLCGTDGFHLPLASPGRGAVRQARPLSSFSTPPRPLTRLHALDPTSIVAAANGGISAWSVTSLTDDLAAQLFQFSLFPYLAFLYFLKKEETGTPHGGFFGFAFLLFFVFATIPAGIYAKIHYHDILANVDILHGSAESMLTLTNLFIVSAFRNAVNGPADGSSDGGGGSGGGESIAEGKPAATAESSFGQRREESNILRSGGAATIAAVVFATAPFLILGLHPEPANALSFPTWMVHVSSLIEWLVAMTYIWRYADVSGVPQWKGLTWGMLPLHTSGLCACTFHILYNAPSVAYLVPVQAALTCFGNATMAFATWRVLQANVASGGAPASAGSVAYRPGRESDLSFYGSLLAITMAGSALVKWGALALDFPFEPSLGPALALILGPTALNIYKWAERSRDPSAPVDGLL